MNIALIGYRGCGKTTVGRILAQRLDLGYVDTDDLIVHFAGKDIATIFAEEGEAGFRQREVVALQAATSTNDCVISLGGGAIESEMNRRRLRHWGIVVWLETPPDVLWQRIQKDPNTPHSRPDLASGGLDEVRQVLERRAPLYASAAHVVVRTEARSPRQVADDVETWLATG